MVDILHFRLRKHLIAAKENQAHMQVLTDAAGHKTAQKLYHQYISDSDYSKLPAFVQALDSLLAHFGAGNQPQENQEDEESAKPVKPAKPEGEDKRDTFG